MAALTAEPDRAAPALEQAIAKLTDVLLAAAQGDFSARAPRSLDGDPIDVLAFLINASIEEIGVLVHELERQREDLRKARAELALAEKLAALGQLAAGVAHELNQPLTAVRMASELLLLREDAPISACRPELELVAEASRRMGRIVDGIRTFARAGGLGVRSTPAAAPVEAALALVADGLRASGIRLVKQIEPAPMVLIDPDRLQQVILNLVLNARDALAGTPDPTIVVSVTATGSCVGYAVEDNGPGVSPEHAARIFDPFFTTKPVGEGTGLGLAISHGIVAEHGAVLRYESVPGGGARFAFELSPGRERGPQGREER